jgi:hypothetical protein
MLFLLKFTTGRRKYTDDVASPNVQKIEQLKPVRPVVEAMQSIFSTSRKLQLLWHLPGLSTQEWHVDSIEQTRLFENPINEHPDWKELIYSVFIAFSDFKINLADYLDFDNEEIKGKQLVEVKRGSLLVITGHTAHAGNGEDATVFRTSTIQGETNQVCKICCNVILIG